MQSTHESDVELVCRWRSGDERGFTQLFRRYQGRIRGMCWKYLRDMAMADDVTQESFCRLLETADRVGEGFNVSAWLHRIAVNLCLDELRRVARREPVATEARSGRDASGWLDELVDTGRAYRPDAAAEAALTRRLVRDAIARLPERQRRVLVLRDVEGMSHAAISATAGIAQGALQGVLHRARERFRIEYVALEGMSPDWVPRAAVRVEAATPRRALPGRRTAA
jgi:RNA polymerase sigma-70 factor, ECF subfamily